MYFDDMETTQDKEQLKIRRAAHAHDQAIEKAHSRGLDSNIESVVGLCAKCNHYQYVENDMHQIIYSMCVVFDKSLGRNKVRNCTQFTPKNQMSIMTMLQIATLIDPGNIRPKAGFLACDDEYTKDIKE
jgi:hypothetical protein